MTQRPPVADWATDFDVMDPAYVEDPFSIWDDCARRAPSPTPIVAVSAWLLTTYADVSAAAHNIEQFSSLEIGVIALRGGA